VSGRNARAGLPFILRDRPDRVGRDRLEILTTLIAGPSFDPSLSPGCDRDPAPAPDLSVGVCGRRL
jgi:hypothetical protein